MPTPAVYYVQSDIIFSLAQTPLPVAKEFGEVYFG
jgi:hypothetical protein